MSRQQQPFTQIVWDSQWELGVTLLDSQHKTLVDIINELAMVFSASSIHIKSQVVKQKHQRWMIGAVLDELVSYTEYHFSAEEAIMKKFGYKESKKHKAAHANFTQKIYDFRDKYMKNEVLDLGENLLFFLRDWLFNHILVSDKEMCINIGLIKKSKDAPHTSVGSVQKKWKMPSFRLPRVGRNKVYAIDKVKKKEKSDRSLSFLCCSI